MSEYFWNLPPMFGKAYTPFFVKQTDDAGVIGMRRSLNPGIENMNSNQSYAIASIVKTWNGGEHVLAGQRASELVYGGKNKADESLLDAITEKIPGIARYVVAPSASPVTQVDDQSGNPLATQPENLEQATGASNLSSEAAKDEQDAIDAVLAPGREARESAGANDTGSTKLNPDGSDEQPKASKKRTVKVSK